MPVRRIFTIVYVVCFLRSLDNFSCGSKKVLNSDENCFSAISLQELMILPLRGAVQPGWLWNSDKARDTILSALSSLVKNGAEGCKHKNCGRYAR